MLKACRNWQLYGSTIVVDKVTLAETVTDLNPPRSDVLSGLGGFDGDRRTALLAPLPDRLLRQGETNEGSRQSSAGGGILLAFTEAAPPGAANKNSRRLAETTGQWQLARVHPCFLGGLRGPRTPLGVFTQYAPTLSACHGFRPANVHLWLEQIPSPFALALSTLDRAVDPRAT